MQLSKSKRGPRQKGGVTPQAKCVTQDQPQKDSPDSDNAIEIEA